MSSNEWGMYSLVFGHVDQRGRFYGKDTVVIDVRYQVDSHNAYHSIDYSFQILNMKPFIGKVGPSRFLIFRHDGDGLFICEA